MKLRHGLEYLLFESATSAGRLLSDRAAARLGESLGRIAYRPLRIRRALVEEQLALAFPERDAAWHAAIARASYAHLGREALAMLRSAYTADAEWLRTFPVHGFDEFREAFAARPGAVFVTGHFGNWELSGATLAARGYPLDAVARPLANPLVDRAVVRTRARLGIRLVTRDILRTALAALRAGRVVGFVGDQDARHAGMFVPFFGRLASTHRTPALLALRADVPLFLGYALREGNGYRGFVERIEVAREGPLDDVVARMTAAWTARLEAGVRRAPEQYFWQHRRWKTRPPEEPAAGVAGIRSASASFGT